MYKYNGGYIELIYGPMFAGKTEELLKRVTRAEYANQRIIVFKPKIDDRYSNDKVVSHNGKEIDCFVTDTLMDIYEFGSHYDIVAIDEVQFFPTHDEVVIDYELRIEGITCILNMLADQGKRVIVTGLDMDFKCEPFTNTMLIAGIAEKVDKLTAICMQCGSPATRSQRLIDGKPAYSTDPVVKIGADEQYEARCRNCHKVLK